MIRPYKKGDTTAYYFKAYHGLDPLTGKKIQTFRRGFKTEREARLAKAKCLAEYEKKNFRAKNTTTTFYQIFEIWKVNYKNTVKESTYVSQVDIVERLILPHFGDKKINKITLQMCQTVVNDWFKNYVNYSNVIGLAGQIFARAVAMEIIESNPMKKVIRPKKRQKMLESGIDEEDNFYDKDELIEFFEAIKSFNDLEMLLYFRLLAFAGVRKSENGAFDWKDFNLNKGYVKLSHTLAKGIGGKTIIQEAKTPESKRVISLDTPTIEMLHEWHKYSTKGLLFKKEDGHPRSIVHANNLLNRVYRKFPDLKRITPQGFRHTHCSLLFESGATIKEVQQRLGHKDIQTTMNIYAHVTKYSKDKTADKFASYIGF
ncbi:putative phage integrase [Streptococcus dysgalactiae]|nr:putative phage integrase [Streptococcus dysgalactiae]SQB83932.1 putative phage integrase [Streptococcus dysgalactiae]